MENLPTYVKILSYLMVAWTFMSVRQRPSAGREPGQTVPGRSWFSYFRLYGPTQAHFVRTWILPDFEKVR